MDSQYAKILFGRLLEVHVPNLWSKFGLIRLKTKLFFGLVHLTSKFLVGWEALPIYFWKYGTVVVNPSLKVGGSWKVYHLFVAFDLGSPFRDFVLWLERWINETRLESRKVNWLTEMNEEYLNVVLYAKVKEIRRIQWQLFITQLKLMNAAVHLTQLFRIDTFTSRIERSFWSVVITCSK